MSSSAPEVVNNDGNRHQLRVVLDLGQHLAAVLARQVEVEQHEVGPRGGGVLVLAAQEPQRRLAVAHDVQLVCHLDLAHGLTGQAHVAGRVLDEEDADGAGRDHAGRVTWKRVPPPSRGCAQIRPRLAA